MKKFFTVVLSLILLCGGISGCSQKGPKEGLVAPSNADGGLASDYVIRTTIRGDIQQVVRNTSPSTFRSVDAATAYFTVSGTVAAVNFTWGDTVKAGDVIATLVESQEYQVALAKAKQALDIAKIGLDQAKAAAEGGGEVALAQLKWQQAQNTYEANKTEQLRLTADTLKATYEDLLGKAQNTYSDLQLSYQIETEKYNAAQANYDACFLKAPLAGELTWLSRTLDAGSHVQAFDPITTIENKKGLVHLYTGSSSDSQYLSNGDVVTVITDTGVQYQGRILYTPTSIPADINYNIGGKADSYNYFIRLEDFDYSQKNNGDPGGDLQILLKYHKNVVLVESYLVKSQTDEDGQKEYYVLMLINGVPIKKFITVGIQNKDYIEVISGLDEGDEVVYLPS